MHGNKRCDHHRNLSSVDSLYKICEISKVLTLLTSHTSWNKKTLQLTVSKKLASIALRDFKSSAIPP